MTGACRPRVDQSLVQTQFDVDAHASIHAHAQKTASHVRRKAVEIPNLIPENVIVLVPFI